MKRVDIEGQFDPSNPWKQCVAGNPEPFRVNRQQISAHEQPSNYTTFCNEVDLSLQKLAKAKALYKIVSFITFGLILIIILLNLPMRLLITEDRIRPIISFLIPLITVIFVIGILIIFSQIRTQMKEVFDEVSDICTKYSVPNNVSYELRDEWWGGCSKHHARRRFLMVDIIVTNDIEHQPQLFHHEKIDNSGSPTPENFDDHKKSNDSPSLFDELKSTL